MSTEETTIRLNLSAEPGLRNAPLQHSVQNGVLIIAIGIDTLAFCALEEHGGPLPETAEVCDKEAWALDVVRKLGRDDDLGTTLVTAMLDDAVELAYEDGSVAIKEVRK
jgi:hypothetical protein